MYFKRRGGILPKSNIGRGRKFFLRIEKEGPKVFFWMNILNYTNENPDTAIAKVSSQVETL